MRPVVSLLERHGGDPVTVDAALSGLQGQRSGRARAVLRIGGADAAARGRRHDARGDDRAQQRGRARFRRLFGWIGRRDGRPSGSGRRCCAGREVALLGAAMPGTPRRDGAYADRSALPCPTCPAGAPVRAAPTRTRHRKTSCARGPREWPRRQARLRLSREPVGACRSWRASGSARRRGPRALLARVTWPGKPGDVGDDRAVDAGGAAAIRCGPRRLQEHLPGLPSTRRPRPGEGRAEPGRLAAGSRRRPTSPPASC